jgi:hypothetical protein
LKEHKVEKLFWDKVNKNGPIPEHNSYLGKCWIWTGYKNQGYGQINIAYANGVSTTARCHRISYKLLKDNNIDNLDLDLDHLCRVRACVNPDHLELKNRQGNLLADGSVSIARKNAIKTHCPQGHEYSPDNVYWYKNMRQCNICRAKYVREFHERKRARK